MTMQMVLACKEREESHVPTTLQESKRQEVQGEMAQHISCELKRCPGVLEEGLMEMKFESVFGGWVGFQSEKDQSYSGKRKCLEQRHGREKRDHEGIMIHPSGIQQKAQERGF